MGTVVNYMVVLIGIVVIINGTVVIDRMIKDGMFAKDVPLAVGGPLITDDIVIDRMFNVDGVVLDITEVIFVVNNRIKDFDVDSLVIDKVSFLSQKLIVLFQDCSYFFSSLEAAGELAVEKRNVLNPKTHGHNLQKTMELDPGHSRSRVTWCCMMYRRLYRLSHPTLTSSDTDHAHVCDYLNLETPAEHEPTVVKDS
ncbi:hypothetical protein NDU88_004975 [Pleurodeles waltl]|uniref:Uncharacterized protein n=1 Tax=Pleurodeles waltl TaxID=8319 RepID=A0AAV7NNV5_PLEWA|nr:hypothetical protein NDU88_004975 [Pleurodeles waltl]